MSEKSAQPEQELAPLAKISKKVNGSIQSAFYGLGLVVGTHPKKVIAAALLLVALTGAGFMAFEEEIDGEKLFTPQDSPAFGNREYVEDTYGFDDLYAWVYITAKNPGDNALTTEVLTDMLTLIDDINKVTAEWEGTEIKLEDICVKVGDECYKRSVLDYWGYDKSAIEKDTDLFATVSAPGYSISGTPLRENDIMGSIEKSADGTISKVGGFKLTYVQAFEQTGLERGEDERALQWDVAMEKVVLNFSSDHLKVSTISNGAMREATRGAFDNDLKWVQMGYLLLIVYGMVSLSRATCIQSHSHLALWSVLSVGLSIVSGFGITSAVGVKYNGVVNTLIFLLLGLGLDDTYVILTALSYTDPSKPTEVRVAEALSKAGASIFVTSFTDFVAFLIGIATVIPALSAFCTFAAIGIFFDFMYQVTFFTAIVAMDVNRQKANKMDFCCCFTTSPSVGCCKCCFGAPEPPPPEADSKTKHTIPNMIMGEWLPQVLKKPLAKAGVLLGAVAILAVAIVGALNIRMEFDYEWFIPDDADVKTAMNVRDDMFPMGGGLPFSVYTEAGDYFGQQAALAALSQSMRDSKYVAEGSVRSWYDDFVAYKGAVPAVADEFYVDLAAFLKDPAGERYADDVVMKEEGGSWSIVSARYHANFVELDEATDQVNAMDDVRAIADNSEMDAFAYTQPFIFIDGYKVIAWEMVRNVLLATTAVFIIILLLFASIEGAVLVLLMVACVEVSVFGFIHWGGNYMNSVTCILVVISVGLSVDYCAHITHAFLVATGTREERMEKALRHIGGAVFNGGITTYLACILLCLSKTYVFKSFFLLLTVIIWVGLYFGLFVMPVVLSLVGPPSYPSELADALGDGSHEEKPSSKAAQGVTEVFMGAPRAMEMGQLQRPDQQS
eukprot:CAMPEP_0197859792 /NCGR_PEP_ID=MMETSP1438-20131217/34679_1 /TAXON_ID=1461541 /ORGANISM="Pterosperma sp., Strain CCMP1384" /LENGTH=896 /DNA_ID=CAMNT_0043476435 /DNA_START=219 /DNA_END=2909 /DNA_ORIENTATION=-